MVVFIRDSSKVPTFDAGHDASSSPPRFPGTVTRTPPLSRPRGNESKNHARNLVRALLPLYVTAFLTATLTLFSRYTFANCVLFDKVVVGETQSGTVGTVSDDGRAVGSLLSRVSLFERSRRGTKFSRSLVSAEMENGGDGFFVKLL